MKKMKYVEQLSMSDCGICCISMMLSYFGYDYTPLYLKNRFNTGKNGINFLNMMNIFKEFGFETKAYKTNKLDSKLCPFILQVKGNHFVCVKNIKDRKLIIYDPAKGIYRRDISLLNDSILYILVVKKENIAKKGISNQNGNKYIDLFFKYKYKIFLLFILSFIVQIISFVIPTILKNVINRYYLNNFIITMIFITIIYFILTCVKNLISSNIKININKFISHKYVSNVINSPLTFFKRIDNSELIYRYNGSNVAKELFSEETLNIFFNIGVAILSIIYIYIQSFMLGNVILIFIVLQLAFGAITFKNKSSLISNEIKSQSKAMNKFMDILSVIEFIKYHNLEKYLYDEWKKIFSEYISNSLNKEFLLSIYNGFNSSMIYFVPFCLTAISIKYVYNIDNQMGNIFIIFYLSSLIISPISNILNIVDDLIYKNKFFDLIYEVKNFDENYKIGLDVSEFRNCIEVKNLNFQYVEGINVLNDINFSIKDNEIIGITGLSGSGKSTLVSTILGQQESYSGKVKISNIDIKKLSKKCIRSNISIVPQSNNFLNDSILNNITLFRSYNKNKVIAACKAACIWDDINKLPMKEETIISNDTNLLSGGQLQRIAIARSLYDNPKILILDEATSSLDAKTENLIMSNLAKMDCTVIFITHRLTTLEIADKILFLENGHINKIGNHEQLLHYMPYKKLYELYLNRGEIN